MQAPFTGRDHNLTVECESGTTVRSARAEAGILASTVSVSHEGVVVPQATKLTSDISLLGTTVSSGG